MKLITFGVIFVLIGTTTIFAFDLRDALPGHVTDDQTTTAKPSRVQRTGDITDADLLAILADDKKKSKALPANDNQNFLKNIQAKLNAIKISNKKVPLLESNYEKAKASIFNWIKKSADVKKISSCFDNIDIYFKQIIKEASDKLVKKIAPATVVKAYNDKLYSTLSMMRGCIISKLKK